jgi:SAM-dependent methyltransferase
MLISQEYKNLNEHLHKNPKYGSRRREALYEKIADFMAETESQTLLDYGCGKGEMAKHLPTYSYDPCVAEFSRRPEGTFDLVACCDVLEHVEPDLLTNVLIDIREYADKAIFLVISTRPASKFLADGRNAHLIVKPGDWWQEVLTQHFPFWQLTITNRDISELTVFGVRNGSR